MFKKNILAGFTFLLISASVGIAYAEEIPTLSVSSTNVTRGDSFVLSASVVEAPVSDLTVNLEFSGDATPEDDYHAFVPIVIHAGETSGSTAIATTMKTGQEDETIKIVVAGQAAGVTVILVNNGTCPGEISGSTSDAALGNLIMGYLISVHTLAQNLFLNKNKSVCK